jgi:hypothetical protein
VGKDMGILRTKSPLSLKINVLERKNGGEGGIRTHGTLARTPVFKTGVAVVTICFYYKYCHCWSVKLF